MIITRGGISIPPPKLGSARRDARVRAPPCAVSASWHQEDSSPEPKEDSQVYQQDSQVPPQDSQSVHIWQVQPVQGAAQIELQLLYGSYLREKAPAPRPVGRRGTHAPSPRDRELTLRPERNGDRCRTRRKSRREAQRSRGLSAPQRLRETGSARDHVVDPAARAPPPDPADAVHWLSDVQYCPLGGLGGGSLSMLEMGGPM